MAEIADWSGIRDWNKSGKLSSGDPTTPTVIGAAYSWPLRETAAFDSADGMPSWLKDDGVFDLEGGCGFGSLSRTSGILTWLSSALFGSSLDHRARNPNIGGATKYQMQGSSMLAVFLWRVLLVSVYCLFISYFHVQLGLSCNPQATEPKPVDDPSRVFMVMWAEALVSGGLFLLLAHGYMSMRAARERMERVRQTAVTIAYAFLKTSVADPGYGNTREELQLIIYECLALLTAYPVALTEQFRGNHCEPAVARYCQEASRALKRLRSGDTVHGADHMYQRRNSPFAQYRDGNEFVPVDYFFETFAVHLEIEYRRQPMATNGQSLASQHIVFNIRNHFENLVDLGNFDDRRTPIIRENIDMMAMAGRECAVSTRNDVVPIAFLWTIDIASRILVFAMPIHNCGLLVKARGTSGIALILSIFFLAIIGATHLTIVNEMWRMWDPFQEGVDSTAWACGVALEIDNMLNEFYEYDTSVLVRKHAYMRQRVYSEKSRDESFLAYPRTV